MATIAFTNAAGAPDLIFDASARFPTSGGKRRFSCAAVA
jgi:hypothetical protein